MPASARRGTIRTVPILLLLAAAVILAGVVSVAMGHGGEMAEFAMDYLPPDLVTRRRCGAAAAAVRPLGLQRPGDRRGAEPDRAGHHRARRGDRGAPPAARRAAVSHRQPSGHRRHSAGPLEGGQYPGVPGPEGRYPRRPVPRKPVLPEAGTPEAGTQEASAGQAGSPDGPVPAASPPDPPSPEPETPGGDGPRNGAADASSGFRARVPAPGPPAPVPAPRSGTRPPAAMTDPGRPPEPGPGRAAALPLGAVRPGRAPLSRRGVGPPGPR